MSRHVVVVALAPFFLFPLTQGQSKSTLQNQVPIERAAVAQEVQANASFDDPRLRLQRELVSHVILERQAQLKRDTEKLLSLAAELKQNVDKTNTNILSMDVIKKAQEIQKLAKSVQDKMKNPY